MKSLEVTVCFNKDYGPTHYGLIISGGQGKRISIQDNVEFILLRNNLGSELQMALGYCDKKHCIAIESAERNHDYFFVHTPPDSHHCKGTKIAPFEITINTDKTEDKIKAINSLIK